jgi:peptide/nickel transport system substrate-binding protein
VKKTGATIWGVLCAAGLILLAAETGCGRPSPTDSAAEGGAAGAGRQTATESETAATAEVGAEPATGDWLIQRLGAEPANLNPLLDTADAYVAQMTGDLYESLLERDKDTLRLKKLLAADYHISEDRLTYTFTFRKDAVFSDGTPLTAHDLLFTYNVIQDPANETADLRNYYKDVISAELIDDYTIKFTCSRPYFKHLDMLGGMPVFPEHVYGKDDFSTGDHNRRPVGSGPYVFTSWETNQQIVFERNPDYWRNEEGGYIDRFIYRIISDENAAFQVLEQGGLDMMGLTAEQWTTRANTPRFEEAFNKHQYWAPSGYAGSYSYIAWNLRKPLFQELQIRRALTMLLDRPTIRDSIYYGLARIVTGPTAYGTIDYDDGIEPWPFDPQNAVNLLEEAGWTDTDGDGVRNKNGQEFEFEFLLPSGSHEAKLMATVYQEKLKKAGIKMGIRELEWATFIDRLTKRAFDAISLAWAIPPDQDPYQVWHSSQSEKGSNYPGYNNPEVDRILEEARLEFDSEKRAIMYRKFHQIIHDDVPYTFLFARAVLVAVDKRFQGVHVYKMGLDTTEWWVPKELRRYE